MRCKIVQYKPQIAVNSWLFSRSEKFPLLLTLRTYIRVGDAVVDDFGLMATER